MKVSSHRTFVIVGGGHAGTSAALQLRAQGFDGRVIMICAERHRPYERPALSKGVLTGAKRLEELSLLPDTAQVDLELGVEVRAIDRAARTLTLSDGRHVGYDRLLLAPGGRARSLSVPGSELREIYVLRTADDALALRAALSRSHTVLVVGGGWIGLEIAAVARQLGCKVVLVEAGERLCARSVPPSTSDFLLAKHVSEGVDVRLHSSVERFEGSAAVERVHLLDGSVLNVDMVVAGVGMVPNTELAKTAGLAVDDGILVDHCCRTSDENIFAAGDVARYFCDWLGRTVRLESWDNAIQQASVAARGMLGEASQYSRIPWFWSDQFEMNLQVLGVMPPDAVRFSRGTCEHTPFDIFVADGLIVGAIAVNGARELRKVKALMEARWRVNEKQLADSSIDLRTLR